MAGKITPGFIMHQIRNGVRDGELTDTVFNQIAAIEENTEIINMDDQQTSEIKSKINANLKRLKHRVTPNMPVAFLDPHLVSRYKLLGKILVPFRKFGARLFTKWYADVFINQQKHLNNDIWFGINTSLEVINDQQQLIMSLNEKLKSQQQVILKMEEQFIEKSEQIDQRSNELIESIQYLEEFKEEFSKAQKMDFNYSKFAEKFSASSEQVKNIYSQYIHHFTHCDTVLDIGCGKGYFLEMLRDNGIKGIGIDSDEQLISICISKGLNAETNDVMNHLRNAEDNSIGGIFMGHVIEHLPVGLKIEFLKLCLAKLKSQGILIIETPNTSSPYVMHNLYYLDPTHEKPLLPEALKHLAIVTGFSVVNSYLSGSIEESIVTPIQYYNYSLILSKE